jgi:hypothetical protein
MIRRFNEINLNDYEAMQSDRERFDEMLEEQYRSAEINFGLDSDLPPGEIDPFYAAQDAASRKPPCRCALCIDPRELPAPRPAASERRHLISSQEVA